MRVTSLSAARSSSLSSVYGSPLPPGSIASTMDGKRLRFFKMRSACMRTVNMLGIAFGVAITNGRKPSQTSRVFSALPITRSEEHTSELQSLMRISYAVFCLKKKTPTSNNDLTIQHQKPCHEIGNTHIENPTTNTQQINIQLLYQTT